MISTKNFRIRLIFEDAKIIQVERNTKKKCFLLFYLSEQNNFSNFAPKTKYMMKKTGFAVMIVCMTMLVACDSDNNNFVINGTVPDEITNGEIVFMTDNNTGLIIDSAAVSSGKFIFKGITDDVKAVTLSLRYDLQADLILDKGTLTIDMSDPYSAKGNPLTEKLNEFYFKCYDEIVLAKTTLAERDESLSEEERSQFEDEVFDNLFAEVDEIAKVYLKEHPNDALGAMIFYIWMQNQMNLTTEWYAEASQLVGDYVLDFGPVKQMVDYMDTMEKTAVGKPFVDFTIAYGNRDGSTVSLSDYVGKGKYVLVDFWASWCMPCRMEAPVLAEVYEKYKGDRFEIVGVAVMDTRLESTKVIDNDGYTWPQILDAQAIPLELYGIQGIPHIILFGPDGAILARDLRGEALKNKVAEVMKR